MYITWHESFWPSGYPAQIMLFVIRFSSYSVFRQSSLLMIGTYTSCNTCDEEPPCFFAPQPVMTPSYPEKLFPAQETDGPTFNVRTNNMLEIVWCYG